MNTSPRQLQLEFAATATATSTAAAKANVNAVAMPPAAPERNRVAPKEDILEGAERLARALSEELGLPVRLAVTDNRSTMVSFRRATASLRVRLHHMFLDAPDPIVRAIADYAGRGRRNAGQVLDDYIRDRQPLIRRTREGSATLEPRGAIYDLQTMFDRLNDTFFQGGISAAIGWGKFPGKRRRKSIRLGVYDHQTREIRIHPALDRVEVPRYFVEFIVFHEMLHQLFPSSNGKGRRVHHPRAFRDREKAYPHYAVAIAWERANMKLLLRG